MRLPQKKQAVKKHQLRKHLARRPQNFPQNQTLKLQMSQKHFQKKSRNVRMLWMMQQIRSLRSLRKEMMQQTLSVIIKMTVTSLQQILRFPLVRMELLYIMQLHGHWQQTNALYIEVMTAASTSSAVLMITMRKHVRVPSIQRSKAERQHCSQRNMPRFRTILPSLR